MENEPGLLKKSLRFAQAALGENSLLRTSVLGTILFVTLLSIALAAFGVTHVLEGRNNPGVYSPRLFGLLFFPAELLLYDLILGNSAPRTTLKNLYLDKRYLSLVWAYLRLYLGLALPLLLLGFFGALALGGLKKLGGAEFFAFGLIVVCGLGFALMLLGVIARCFFLPIVVARREPRPLSTAFHETKGKVWQMLRVLALPYLAIAAVTVPMELLGTAIERRLGFVGLAPWFLLDAFVTGFFCCVSGAVLAFAYQRVIGAEGQAGPDVADAQQNTAL